MNADDFRKHRSTLGLDVDEAATVLGLHRRTVFKYESGERDVPRTVEFLLLAYVADARRARRGGKEPLVRRTLRKQRITA